jgi:hypothetical protein
VKLSWQEQANGSWFLLTEPAAKLMEIEKRDGFWLFKCLGQSSIFGKGDSIDVIKNEALNWLRTIMGQLMFTLNIERKVDG